jgi:hypothetical protein
MLSTGILPSASNLFPLTASSRQQGMLVVNIALSNHHGYPTRSEDHRTSFYSIYSPPRSHSSASNSTNNSNLYYYLSPILNLSKHSPLSRNPSSTMHFLGYLASTLAVVAVSHCAPTKATTQDKAFDTCTNLSSDRQVLQATCDDGDGRWIVSSVNLNDCFTNNNGRVQVSLFQSLRALTYLV